MRIQYRLVAGILAAGLAAGAADASSVTATFDLSGRGGHAPSHSYGSGDLTLETSAYLHSNGVLGQRIGVGRWSTGLGAAYSGDDSHLVDGHGPDEMLVFDFGREVTIESAVFSYYDPSDDAEIATYAGTAPSAYLSNVAIDPLRSGDGDYLGESDDFGIATLTGARRLSGSVFGIGSNHWSDQFKIHSITVSYMAAVPLPASALLLFGALFGTAALRRTGSRRAAPAA